MPTYIAEAIADLPDGSGAYALFSIEGLNQHEADAIAEERLLRRDVDWEDAEGQPVDADLPKNPRIIRLKAER